MTIKTSSYASVASPLPATPETSQPPHLQPKESNAQSTDEPSTRPIYRNSGPSAALVERIVAQQTALKGAPTSSAKAVPNDLAADLREELRTSGLDPRQYVNHLLAKIREACPEGEEAFIDGALAGLTEALNEILSMHDLQATPELAEWVEATPQLEQEESSKEKEQNPERPRHPSESENVTSSLLVDIAGTLDHDEIQPGQEIAIELRRSAFASGMTKTEAASMPFQQKISDHLMTTYFRPILDEEKGDPGNQLATCLNSVAKAFIEAGCKTTDDVDKMLTKLVGNHRLLHGALSGFAELGFTASMMTVMFEISPRLPANMNSAEMRTALGVMVGWGMTVLSEALSGVRDNHIPQVKPTGIPAIDKLLPSLVKAVLIAASIGTACTFVKNTTRVWAPATWAEPMPRQEVSNMDTRLDSFLSPLAAWAASYFTNRMLYPQIKTLMLAQKNFPDILKNFNKPGTLQSRLDTLKEDVKTVAAKGARAALAPSTLAVTAFITVMVLALLSAKHAATEGFQSHNPQLPQDKITKAEAATLGSISLFMMAVLTQLAPLIFSSVQHKVDQPIYNAYNHWRTRRNPKATPIEVGGGMEMTLRATA